MLIQARQLNNSTIELPLSKSVANRAIILSQLYGTPQAQAQLHSQLSGTVLSDDIRVMLRLTDRLHIDTDFTVEASGTAMRFGTALLAVTPGTRTITGTQRLCQRPIAPLVDALRQLGADIQYLGEEGFPPLRITGKQPMKGGPLTIRGDISSQFISALLMIAPTFQQPLQLTIEGEAVSQPYVEMTRRMVSQQAWDTIEPDWSAAAFWYEISVLSGIDFQLPGLRADSVQGDRVCHDIFEQIRQNTDLHCFCYDFTDCPDLVQAVVVTCCMKHIPFHFTGLQTLRIKETDRIAALQNEMAKLGIEIHATDSEMWSDSISRLASTAVDAIDAIDTYNDHRMAMAFAPCAITLGSIRINDPEVVTKSYPTYWDDLKKAGFEICSI